MKNKATHNGHCQVCGAEQKLPAGQLSTHGYTVEFNFFNGICFGTRHLPFEQDISLIEGAIQRALAIQSDIKIRIAKYTNSTESSAWFNVYKPCTDSRGRKVNKYVWEYIPVITKTTHRPAEGAMPEYWSHRYSADPLTIDSYQHSHSTDSNFNSPEFPMAEVVEYRNKQYRRLVLEEDLRRITHYISWQRERIRDWKPSELKPIEPPKPPDPNRAPRRRWR